MIFVWLWMTEICPSMGRFRLARFQYKCFQDESGDTVCQLHLHHVNLNDLPCCHVATSCPGDRASCCCPGFTLSSFLLTAFLGIVKLKRWAWWPPWWWQQLLMGWELGRCPTQWWEKSSLQNTGPSAPAWPRLSGGSILVRFPTSLAFGRSFGRASGLGNLTRSIQPLQPPSFIISLLRSVTVFALVKAIPHVILHLGLPSIFFFHGGVCALAAIFASRFVPETRGKTLSQLCSIYEAKKTPSSWIWEKNI